MYLGPKGVHIIFQKYSKLKHTRCYVSSKQNFSKWKKISDFFFSKQVQRKRKELKFCRFHNWQHWQIKKIGFQARCCCCCCCCCCCLCKAAYNVRIWKKFEISSRQSSKLLRLNANQWFPNFAGARTTLSFSVLRKGQNTDLYMDWRTTWAKLEDHQWSEEQTLGNTVVSF